MNRGFECAWCAASVAELAGAVDEGEMNGRNAVSTV